MNIQSFSPWIILLILLSVYMGSCVGTDHPDKPSSLEVKAGDATTFQEYLWQEHPVDLILQIGLLIAGALGVTALLPTPDEDQSTND